MAHAPVPRLRITPRSAVVAVGLFGLTLLALRMFVAAGRVVGWLLMAASVAGLLHPLVARLARRLPRGLSVLVVVLGTLAIVGTVAYGTVRGIQRETHVLQDAAPRRAAELERKGRFAQSFREFRLAEKTREFVKDAPARLQGGSPSEALRSAATRGVAFLATTVLTIFLLLHGPRLAAGARDQLSPRWRLRAERVAVDAFQRGFGYARGALFLAALSGLIAYAGAKLAAVPGPAPLALWVALWSLVPSFGFFLGAVPIIVLAGVVSPRWAVAIAVVFLAWQVVEVFVLRRRLERRTLRLGPFLTFAGAFVGLELYGFSGALLAVLALALGAAVITDVGDDGPPAPAAQAERRDQVA